MKESICEYLIWRLFYSIITMDLEGLGQADNQGSDAENSQGEGANNEVNLAGGNRVDQKKKKEKQRRPVKVVRLEDLTNRETGIKSLYLNVKKNEPKLTKKALINPEKALEDYLTLVKEWAFNVAPKYEFGYFMDRTQTLGHKREFTEELSLLRKFHKGDLIYDTEEKEYRENTAETRRVLITEEGPQVMSGYKNEYVRPTVDDYDPAADPDRVLETFISKEDLEYNIKKKTVKQNDENRGSPSVEHNPGMDIEYGTG